MTERMTEERLAEIREAVGDDWHWAFVEGEGFCHFPDGVTPEYASDQYPSAKAFNAIPDLLAEIDFLRAELAEARLAAAVDDGTATPEMLRDAGLLDGWECVKPEQDCEEDCEGQPYWERWVGLDNARSVEARSVGWFIFGLDEYMFGAGEAVVVEGNQGSTLANLRAADAAVRKLLAEGEAAG